MEAAFPLAASTLPRPAGPGGQRQCLEWNAVFRTHPCGDSLAEGHPRGLQLPEVARGNPQPGGRLHREEEAVQEALVLWEERERRRAEILAAVDEAEASLARGEGQAISETSMRQLAQDVKQQGRAGLAAEQLPSH